MSSLYGVRTSMCHECVFNVVVEVCSLLESAGLASVVCTCEERLFSFIARAVLVVGHLLMGCIITGVVTEGVVRTVLTPL